MKKHHKVHRHKDANHKHSSKSKHHHKHKKEYYVSESVLEPIQELSKEKVKIDKNACGDHVNSLAVPQSEDVQKRKQKHRGDKNENTNQVKKLDQEETNIFAKNYLQKLRESTNEKLVRHDSLERSGDSPKSKTKSLFKKEKSFNGVVQKVSNDVIINEHKKDKTNRRHKSKKSKKSDEIKEKRERHKNREISSKRGDPESKEKKLKDKEEKRKRSSKKRTKSMEKLPANVENSIYSRVQEVIYCQLDQVPYKLKNDKSGAEIKDLYQRIKGEKRHDKERDRSGKDKTFSQEKNKNKDIIEKDRSHRSNQNPFLDKMDSKQEKEKKRSRSHSKRVYDETIEKTEENLKKHSKKYDFNNGHHRHCHLDQTGELFSKKSVGKKCKKGSLSNIDLGPYHRYFAFENNSDVKHSYKKRNKEDDEHKKVKSSSTEQKCRDHQEESLCYQPRACKRRHERHEDKTEPIKEDKLKTEEDKIHEIVEGDLKSYFSKIQHMIDQKLDAIIHNTKSRHKKTSETKLRDKEHRKRSKSRTNDKKSEKEERSGNKQEHKNKHNKPEDNDEVIIKEEIVQEVLKRIKNEDKKESYHEKKESKVKAGKEIDIKHKSTEIADKISNDKKNPSLSKIRQDISIDRKRDENYSKSKRRYENVRNLEQHDPSPPRKHSDRKHLYEEVNKPQDYRQMKFSNRQDNRKLYNEDKNKGSKDSRSPDNISKTNNLKDSQDCQRLSDKKPRSSKKLRVPHGSPELVIPAADISALEWETYLRSKIRHKNPHTGTFSGKGDLSYHSLRKHYTSVSSYRACSEHLLMSSKESKVVNQKSEQIITDQYGHRHVARDGLPKERCHMETRKNSSPQRTQKEICPAGHDSNYISCHMHNRMPEIIPEAHYRREHLVASHPEDYIMTPRDHRKSKHRVYNHDPVRHHSRHDIVVEYTAPNLEKIILPPEMFRTPEIRINSPREQIHYHGRLETPKIHHPRQEFLVQGIEPPILECSRQNSRGRTRIRNLECKTVSIVGIPPQIIFNDTPMANQTQTYNKSQKSITPDRDLVEKRKHSKRFRLYYKYSIVNNKEDDDSGTDAISIVSDSYRMISDLSEEEKGVAYYPRDAKTTRERHVTSELPQTLNSAQKKWNRIATPRDSHLNNIIEEPSNISDSIKIDEYFIPIRSTNECYFRALTSSHSEYCFKINKKAANSNISIVSKDNCDGRYRYYEDSRCRYCKYNIRSKSDVNVVLNGHGIQIFRSKSDVVLFGASGKKVIKSIFLEESHPYVKSKAKQNLANQKIFKEKEAIKTCKDCQTSDIKVSYGCVPMDEEETQLIFEDKQKQFKDIYKTIDDLEENIHCSRRTPPQTLDIAISSKFMSLDRISDKKTQFKEIYKTIDTLQNKMIHSPNNEVIKTVDVASESRGYKDERSRTSESKKNTHEIAVGDSTDHMVTLERTPSLKSGSMGKQLKSTGVSPIRVVEELKYSSNVQARKTPVSPNTRPNTTRPSTQRHFRNIQDDSLVKNTIPRVAETKKEPISLIPKALLVKTAKGKSPERRRTDSVDRRNLKQVDISSPGQAIRVLRSDEKSAHLKKRELVVQNRPKDSKAPENTTKTITDNDQILQKDAAISKVPYIFVNVLEDGKPIITIPTKDTQVLSKVPIKKYIAKEKSEMVKKQLCQNRGNDFPKSCVHQYPPKNLNVQNSSKTTPAPGKTSASIPKIPVTVNTALIENRPVAQNKYVSCKGSTSSSLDDTSAQNIRRSRSLVEIRTQRKSVNRSKSEIINVDSALVICESRCLETNGESVTSGNMEKFANVPRLRCHNSKSNVHSLDQFIGHKFTSRLLLTKDYKGGEVSAYQRRKLYDQSIRQKMKRKFRFSKLDVGPQIYEVRFLSMVGQKRDQRKGGDAREKHYAERPLITLNLKNMRTDSTFYHEPKNSIKFENKNKICDTTAKDTVCNPRDKKDLADQSDVGLITEEISKSTSSDELAVGLQIENDRKEIVVDQNSHTEYDSNSVKELYFKDEKVYQDKLLSFCNKLLEVNSSLEFPEKFGEAHCTCSKYSNNCQSCKNFVYLMDKLCSSVASYCDSKTRMVNFKLEDDAVKNLESGDQHAHINMNTTNTDNHFTKEEPDNLHVCLPNMEIQEASSSIVQEIYSRSYNNSSGESTNQSDKIFKNLVECVSLATTNKTDNLSLPQPLSCPVLPTSISSFEFLYEETSSENEGASHEITVANLTKPFDQTFNINLSQYNAETPFFQRDFSATGSSESGYASVKSKSCMENSLSNLFKRPNISALLKPPVLARLKGELTEDKKKSHKDFKTSILYEEMTKNCQLYAKKVRESTEMECTNKGEEYQEFSLAFLLGKNNSVMLESTALREQSNTHVASKEDAEFISEKSETNIENDDISDVGDGSLKCSEITFVENGCRLVLSNESLKIDSFTYFGAEIFNEECSDLKSDISKDYRLDDRSKKDHDENSSFTLDFSLDLNNPFMPSKDVVTQKFFGSLLKVYEKEMEFCSELFKTDEFLQNVLLPAVKERKIVEKRKKGKFRRFFKNKLKGEQTSTEESKSKQTNNLQVKASARLQTLASKAKKCFSMFAEAVKINENIDDEIKICGLLKMLERIETGDFYMIRNETDLNIEQDIKSQVKEAFINIYQICEKEAKKAKRTIGDQEINLIKGLISKYRIGLLSKTDILACYIGRGVIRTDAQLKG